MFRRGFSVIELVVVLAVIVILAGLILSISGYVQNKARRARAQAEIQAISAALENYKADNGIYPYSSASTDTLNAQSATPNFPAYQNASAILYQGLTGDINGDGQSDGGARSYMQFKPNQLGGASNATFIEDPFRNSYGYSTAGQAAALSGGTQSIGYNPTFDLWSTSGSTTASGQTGWVTNW